MSRMNIYTHFLVDSYHVCLCVCACLCVRVWKRARSQICHNHHLSSHLLLRILALTLQPALFDDTIDSTKDRAFGLAPMLHTLLFVNALLDLDLSSFVAQLTLLRVFQVVQFATHPSPHLSSLLPSLLSSLLSSPLSSLLPSPVIADTMSEHDMSTTAAMFSAFDRNHDGRLSIEDLRQGFKQSGVTLSTEDLLDLMRQFDKDGDQALDYSELLCLIALLAKKDKAKEIFTVVDRNGNQRISRSELKKAMRLYMNTKPSEKEMDVIMAKIDFNDDGYISFEEFSRAIDVFESFN